MKIWLIRIILAVALGLALLVLFMKTSALPSIHDCRILTDAVGALYRKTESSSVVSIADYPGSIQQLNPKRVFINPDGYIRIWLSGGGVTSQKGYVVLVTMTERNARERLSFLKNKVGDGVFIYEME